MHEWSLGGWSEVTETVMCGARPKVAEGRCEASKHSERGGAGEKRCLWCVGFCRDLRVYLTVKALVLSGAAGLAVQPGTTGHHRALAGAA